MSGAQTYGWLSAAFLAAAVVVFAVAIARANDARALLRRWWASVAIAAVIILVLTAVFDNVMIAAGFFSYSSALISGAHIGRAPVEDFSYPLAACILVPSLWSLTRSRNRAPNRESGRHE